MTQQSWREVTIEKLAAIEHERWADWQKYCHSKMIRVGDGMHSGKLAMDIGDESRWEKQINTPYSELSEAEKQSDRDQVMRYWPLIDSLLSEQRGEMERKAKNEGAMEIVAKIRGILMLYPEELHDEISVVLNDYLSPKPDSSNNKIT
jgi:hypothetical protein